MIATTLFFFDRAYPVALRAMAAVAGVWAAASFIVFYQSAMEGSPLFDNFALSFLVVVSWLTMLALVRGWKQYVDQTRNVPEP